MIIRIAGVSVCIALMLAYCIEWLVRPTLVVITPDSAGYMHPALALYYGVDLEAPGWTRTFGYPLFLTFVLGLSGSFLHVPTVQMLLVAGTALLTVITISMSTSAQSRKSFTMALLQAALSILAVFGLLRYQPLTNQAHELIPEALYTFLATATLLLIWLALSRRYPTPILVCLYFVGTLVSTYTYSVKLHWGAAMLFTWTAMSLSVIGATWQTHRRSIVLLGIALTGSIVCFAVSQMSREERSSYILLCNHANLVAPIIDTLLLPPDSAAVIKGILERTASGGPNGWNILGLNGDDCMYRSGLYKYLLDIKGDPEAVRGFMLRAFYAGVLNDPKTYAAKVIKQIWYALENPFPNIDQTIESSPERYRKLRAEWGTTLFIPTSALQGRTTRPLITGISVIDAFSQWLLEFANRHAWIVWILVPILLFSTGVLSLCGQTGSVLPVLLAGGVYLSSTVVVALSITFDVSRYLEAIAPLAMVFLAVVILHVGLHIKMWINTCETAFVTRLRNAKRGSVDLRSHP
jgi:hypothetical protein